MMLCLLFDLSPNTFTTPVAEATRRASSNHKIEEPKKTGKKIVRAPELFSFLGEPGSHEQQPKKQAQAATLALWNFPWDCRYFRCWF
jgi:hypothetical protein